MLKIRGALNKFPEFFVQAICCVVRYTNMAICEMGEMDIEC